MVVRTLGEKGLENIVGKGENAGNQLYWNFTGTLIIY